MGICCLGLFVGSSNAFRCPCESTCIQKRVASFVRPLEDGWDATCCVIHLAQVIPVNGFLQQAAGASSGPRTGRRIVSNHQVHSTKDGREQCNRGECNKCFIVEVHMIYVLSK